MPKRTENLSDASMTRGDYQALVERMLAMQLKEAEQLADFDENGLETIDLTDDIGATTSGLNSADVPKPAAANFFNITDKNSEDPPEKFLRKTKSNNFFAVDDSQDMIQPFDEDDIEK